MTSEIRIGTRTSPLAMWQANETARRLEHEGYSPIIVPIKTTGDKRRDVSLATIGGKGLFVKELEEALLRGEIDLAVHSLKDVPSIIPEDFVLAGFLDRADPRDAWLQRDSITIDKLPAGSLIGTSAPRRKAQLLGRYPHLAVGDVRGNVDTRIESMRSRRFDAVVLAGAGLARLGRGEAITSYFSVDDMVPAAGQGIVGIETLRTNAYAADAAASINDSHSELAARCERGVLQEFGELLDCTSCIAVHATRDDSEITIRAFVSETDGRNAIHIKRRGIDADALVRNVAAELVELGAMQLLGVFA